MAPAVHAAPALFASLCNKTAAISAVNPTPGLQMCTSWSPDSHDHHPACETAKLGLVRKTHRDDELKRHNVADNKEVVRMTLSIALLLTVLLLSGIVLFIRAYVQGMRFGDRLEAEKSREKRDREKGATQEPTDQP